MTRGRTGPLRPRLALALLALVVAACVPAYAVSIAKTHRQAVERERLTALERELVPTEMSLVDPEVFLLARERMPRDARYLVLAAPHEELPQIAVDAAHAFAPYLLLPRRRVETPRDADWVIVYGGDLDALGLEVGEVVEVAPGRALAEVRG